MVCFHGSNMMESFLIYSRDKWCQARLCTSPILFSMMFSATLTAAFQDDDKGIPIRYRFEGKLFNLRRLQAKAKVQTEVLDEFLFADDMVKGAPTEEKMQTGVDQVSDSCDSYDLTISVKKDRGGLSTSTWQALQGAHHSSEKSKIASSPTLEAHCQKSCTLMMKSMPGLPKQHLADYVVVFGIEVESGDTNLNVTYNTIVCMQNVDSLPTARQKTEPLPYKLP